MSEIAMDHLQATGQVLSMLDWDAIHRAYLVLSATKKNGNTVFTFGNGGSHANASHFAVDLFKTVGIKTICVSEMTSTMLAYMNDEGMHKMFSQIVRKMAKKDDVIVAFSCSGESINILWSLLEFNNLIRILLSGSKPFPRAIKNSDVVISVPNDNIRIQESAHSAICHALTEALIA